MIKQIKNLSINQLGMFHLQTILPIVIVLALIGGIGTYVLQKSKASSEYALSCKSQVPTTIKTKTSFEVKATCTNSGTHYMYMSRRGNIIVYNTTIGNPVASSYGWIDFDHKYLKPGQSVDVVYKYEGIEFPKTGQFKAVVSPTYYKWYDEINGNNYIWGTRSPEKVVTVTGATTASPAPLKNTQNAKPATPNDVPAPKIEPAASVAKPKAELRLLQNENFDINANDPDPVFWKTYDKFKTSSSQAVYLADNVKVQNGNLIIKTERLCVDKNSPLLQDKFYALQKGTKIPSGTIKKCKKGEVPVYSSGYVQSIPKYTAGKIEIRAKMAKAQNGYWPAFWMQNWPGETSIRQDSISKPGYGEMDITEQYGNTNRFPWQKPGPSKEKKCTSFSTTHITSGTSSVRKDNIKSIQQKASICDSKQALSDDYHTYAVEWDRDSIKYIFDGKTVTDRNKYSGGATVTFDDFKALGATKEDFNNAMNGAWDLKIQAQLVKPVTAAEKKQGKTNWTPPPDNGKDFVPMYTMIDYIKVWRK